MSDSSIGKAEVSGTAGTPQLRISGDWLLPHYAALTVQTVALRATLDERTQIDLTDLGKVDTAGAQLLFDLLGLQRLSEIIASDTTLPPERRALLHAVGSALAATGSSLGRRRGSTIGDVLEHIGEGASTFARNVRSLLGFIGLTLESGLLILLRPRRWRITSLVVNLEKTAFDAVPIVALLTFLVGAVIAFLGATTLAKFGASTYTVSLVAYAFLREFGVLLAAILVAGRTASAFAAQIGSMLANEEIDAIRVQGLSPMELLVLPRVWALMLALPMLTFIAMVSGIVGGMAVCALSLDISPTMFLTILQRDIRLNHFFVGMAKAPIFAFLIAVIGCLEGFKVSGSAQSVGEHTTSAVVQSIFVVIVVDAIAAMVCMEMRW